MIVKPCDKPIFLKKLEALLRRLPENHPKRADIESVYNRELAGYRGQQSLDYHLESIDKDLRILHNVRLLNEQQFFQIDTLVITTNFILILEVKNIKGTLYFDPEFNQMIRTREDAEDCYQDPVLQVTRQKEFLSNWLSLNKFPNIPIETKVVISHPSTIIKVAPGTRGLSEIIIRSAKLSYVIKNLQNKYPEPILESKTVIKLTKSLIKQDTPYDPQILEKYNLSPDEIMVGVHCPSCNTLPIKRTGHYWYCHNCAYHSKTVYLDSLNDYFLLINSTITNQQFRDFLLIQSRSSAYKLIKVSPLQKTGLKKGSVYKMIKLQ